MGNSRRWFIKGGLALLALAALPRALLAAAWPEKVFGATNASDALKELFGTDATVPSGEITLKAPDIAENGSVVPVSVTTTLANVESIAIVVENNPRPMAASFDIAANVIPDISCRIKMGKTSDVMAVVRTADGIYSTSKEVKVTIGGCGG